MFQKRKLVLLVAVFLSLSLLAQTSCKNKTNKVEIDNVGEIFYPQDIEPRNDVPFALLVDNEFKQKLGEGIDYEKYRPNYIFLKKAFNEKDTAQLNDFGCIQVTLYPNTDNVSYELSDDFVDKLILTASKNVEGTNYEITGWDSINKNVSLPDGSKGIELGYKQTNTKTNKVLDITSLYLVKDGKLITINMSAPQSMSQEWNGYYKEMVSNLKLK